MTHQLQAIVHGRVQGVGYRYFVARRAAEHGVAGTVRNLPDGSVEVVAEGALPALRGLLDELRTGPGHARVESVDERWSEGAPRHRSFEIAG